MSRLTLHTLLRYSQHKVVPNHCCYLLWDLRESPTFLRHVSNPTIPLGDLELSQPATSPPVSSLRITCGIFPESWSIEANNYHGVTIRDILQAIYNCLQTQITHEEWGRMSLKHRDRVSNAFDARWRVAADPAGTYGRGVLRVDCILRHTWFAGLTVSLESEDSCILTLRCPQ